ncbi:MAG TPA: DNA primase, partial [Acidimicrobiales bacterium]|nr:DNA primase [Acidimicrobiales bacterium]
MGIVAEDVERARSAVNLVELVSEKVALRRVGTRWVGLCPFHSENTPSFSVNAELGRYYCFGCQARGDAISFLRETEHMDFPSAVEALASRTGITLRYDSTERAGAGHKRAAELVEVMERAVEWYHERLLGSLTDDAKQARAYLRSERGYDSATVRHFRLGWAPDGWDTLVRQLGAPVELLVGTGLAFRNQAGRLNDSFRARVLFPIFDAGGRPVGFGGRTLPGAQGPKYKNTQTTPLYDKSRVLYGLNWAKGAVVERRRVVVCEGYTDVIGLHQTGVTEAVATCGTALAEGHVKLLTGFSRRIVLAYDADSAGQGAAGHFYDWERKYEADISVVSLPAGADPADVARRDPAGLHQAVENATPYLGFRLR